MKTANKGVTLAELLLVIALIAILAAVFLPITRISQRKNDVASATDIAVQSLRRAQALSQAVDQDSPWGVKINNGNITIFKGASYAGRDTNFDEVYSINSHVGVAGVSEVVFSKMLGETINSGSMTLSWGSDNKIININGKGIVTSY